MNVAPADADPGENAVDVQGRRIGFPVTVRDACSGSATWLVNAAAARRLLPAPDLDVVELLPGRALFSLACIDYRDNDLGDYNEVSLALFVREKAKPRGIPWLGTALDFLRSRVSTFIVWLPVAHAFTREAGEKIWGFPKTVETIDFDHAGERARCTLTAGGRNVLSFSMPRGGERSLPENAMFTYTRQGGRTMRTRFVTASAGVGFHRGGIELTLGDHTMSETLRSLGLPRAPLFGVWMESMRATFEAPERLGNP
jgi:hypothetical protein